jgi:redox-sensing transcriptional repressor
MVEYMGRNGRKFSDRIARSTVERLLIYYRAIDLMEKDHVMTTNSTELARIGGSYPAQVRKDLSYFGCFGCRGMGYDVHTLKSELSKILGLDRKWNIVVIGAGQFSDVMISSQVMNNQHFTVKKIFDKAPEKIKDIYRGISVYHMNQIEREIDPEEDDIAVIALPPPEIQRVIDRLGKVGLKGVLYLASRSVTVPKNMTVLNEDVSMTLGMLAYQLTRKKSRLSNRLKKTPRRVRGDGLAESSKPRHSRLTPGKE